MIKQSHRLWLALALLVFCVGTTMAKVKLVPLPQSMQWTKGTYNMSNQVTIAYGHQHLKAAAAFLQQKLSDYVQVSASVQPGKQGDISLQLKKSLPKGGYELSVSTKGIRILGADDEGLIAGIQSLNQMLLQDGKRIDCVEIKDYPRFGWRGFHLDSSRHFFTVDEVKRIIDLMSLYKLNRFHWHLTDDQGWRLEIKKYPLLTDKGAWRIYNDQDTICMKRAVAEDNPDMMVPKKNTKVVKGDTLYGGYYTQDEVRDIVKYAAVRGIQIVPEIDMPGHFLSAIENYDGLSCFKKTGWGKYFTTPLCPGKDKALDFCKDIWSEVFSLFPYEYVHVGGDEVAKDNWKKCPDCQKRIKEQGLKNEEELQSWFIHEMEKYINQHGRKLIGWDEIIEGGLSKTSTVMWWRPWVPSSPYEAVRHGNDVIFCPGNPFYFNDPEKSHSLQSIYDFVLPPKDMTAKEKKHVIGVQCNLWCEWVPSINRALFEYFPRTLAMSEMAWTEPQHMKYDNFYERLTQGQFAMLNKLHVPYHIPDPKGVYGINAFTKQGVLNISSDDPNAVIRYTTDGSIPTKNSTLYAGPVTVDETTHFILRPFAPDGRGDNLMKVEFVKQGLLEPVDAPTAGLASGLKTVWHDYGTFNCSDMDTAAVKATYVTPDVMIPEGVKGHIGLIITGYINIPADGVYSFGLKSDDGSWLKIDGNMVVDNDGPHPPSEATGQCALKAGLHKIEVRYWDNNGGMLRLNVFDRDGKLMDGNKIYLHQK